jgi:hypothetical protein
MKSLIQEEILSEKMLDKPDTYYLSLLDKLMQQQEPLTFKQWVNTGRFMRRSEYLTRFPEAKLEHECSDLVKYAGGFIAQALTSGGFLCSVEGVSEVNDTLSDAEKFLWDNKIKFII